MKTTIRLFWLMIILLLVSFVVVLSSGTASGYDYEETKERIESFKQDLAHYTVEDTSCKNMFGMRPTRRHAVIFQECEVDNDYITATIFKHITIDLYSQTFTRHNGWKYKDNIHSSYFIN